MIGENDMVLVYLAALNKAELTPSERARVKRLQERQFCKAWNLYHPEAKRPIPALVPIENVPKNIDALDVLLAIYIAQATLDS